MSLDTQIKQIKALLIKYDFFKMIGATLETPTNQTRVAYTTWFRQDKLIFDALVGMLDLSLATHKYKLVYGVSFWKLGGIGFHISHH